jgi:ribosomal protein S18 acetylase RimI-like enzyme
MPVPYIRFALPETTRSGASTMARGHGVGRALFRAAVDEARRQGARRITLRVLGHNTPARKLYESEGFVVEGTTC